MRVRHQVPHAVANCCGVVITPADVADAIKKSQKHFPGYMTTPSRAKTITDFAPTAASQAAAGTTTKK